MLDRLAPDRRLPCLIAAVLTAATLVLVGAVGWLAVQPEPVDWLLPMIVALVALARLAKIGLRVGGDRVRFVWGDAALVVGLAYLNPPLLVLATAAGMVIAGVIDRRPPVKLAYSLAATVTATAAAAAVVELLVRTPPRVTSVAAVAALILAAGVFNVITDVATSAAIALSARGRLLSVLRDGAGLQVLMWAGNVACGIGVLVIAEIDVRLILLLLPVLIAVQQGYAARLRARAERGAWEQLTAATGQLTHPEEDALLWEAAGSARALFSAETVEIDTAAGDGRPRHLVRVTAADGVQFDGPPVDAPPAGGQDVAEIPITSGGDQLGMLRLYFPGANRLTEREQATVQTFAAALAGAIGNARLHAETRAYATDRAYAASHDPKTGLPNRAALLEHCRLSGAAGRSPKGPVALLLFDLRGWRTIVDTCGYDVGDAVTVHAAGQLRAAAAAGEFVAFTGDELAVWVARLADPARVVERAHELLAAIARPLQVQGLTLTLDAAAGIAYSPTAATDPAEMLRQAAVALHLALRSGSRVDTYTPDRDASTTRLVLASEIRTALRDSDQLHLVYQPIVDLRTGEAVAAEALIRWQHPTRGLLRPEQFVHAAEDSGVLREFTRRTLRMACAEAHDWARKAVLVPVQLSISSRCLLDREFPGQVAGALAMTRLPPARLVLALSHSTVLSDLDVVDTVLADLRALGVQLCLDGFGTGHSTLARLARVDDVDEVKIAAEFVAIMLKSPPAKAIISATVELGRSLTIRVVAEGVSTAAHRSALVALGCQYGQGPHLSPPCPAGASIRMMLWTSTATAELKAGADIIGLAEQRQLRRWDDHL